MSSSPTGTTTTGTSTSGTGPTTTPRSGTTGTGPSGTGPVGTSTSRLGTSSATGATKTEEPKDEEVLVGPELYKWFLGAFIGLLSLIVLVSTGSILSVLVLFALIALLVSSLVYYGFLDISEYLETKVSLPTVVPAAKPAGGPLVGSEVYHIDAAEIDGKGFTYEEAPAVCAAFDSEIASLEQIVAAYNAGAEWCSYGWSSGGMALYPTQKGTWDQLQTEIDIERRTRCGRPGVNGGYMDPLLRLGVNCYGFKPKGDFKPPAPLPGGDPQAFKALVNRFKEMMNKLAMAPFSRQRWSGARMESFVGTPMQSYGHQFAQSFTTPRGVVEHLVGGTSGDPYVESVNDSGTYGAAPYGLQGDAGPVGPTGMRGTQGIQGSQGSQGMQGPRGDPGQRGEASTVPGPLGPTGRPGERGPQGTAGRDADAGATGPKGENGAASMVPGPTGMPGRNGTNGTNGRDGAPGTNGRVGDTGPPGPIKPDLKVQSLQIGNQLLYTVNRRPDEPLNEELIIQPNHPQNRPANQLPPKAVITWSDDKANLWLQNSSWGNDARNWRRLAWGTNDQYGGRNDDIGAYGAVARRPPPL